MGATCRRQEPVRRRLAAAPAVYTTPTPAGLGLCRWLASEQCRPAWQRCLPLRLCPMGSLPRRRRPSSRPGARWSPAGPSLPYRRENVDALAAALQRLHLAGEPHAAVGAAPPVEGADTDGVTRRAEVACGQGFEACPPACPGAGTGMERQPGSAKPATMQRRRRPPLRRAALGALPPYPSPPPPPPPVRSSQMTQAKMPSRLFHSSLVSPYFWYR